MRGGGASAARGAQTPPPNRPGQLSPSLLRKPREQTPQSRLQAGVGGEAGSKPALGGAGEGGSREVPSACPREKLPEPAQPLPAKAGTLRGCLQAHLTGFTPSSKRFPPDTPIPAVPGPQPHPPWPSRCPSLSGSVWTAVLQAGHGSFLRLPFPQGEDSPAQTRPLLQQGTPRWLHTPLRGAGLAHHFGGCPPGQSAAPCLHSFDKVQSPEETGLGCWLGPARQPPSPWRRCLAQGKAEPPSCHPGEVGAALSPSNLLSQSWGPNS